MNAKAAAKNLPCLFESLANEYDESQLTRCETKQNQKWRHAAASAAAESIMEMAKYFPKLSVLLDSLDSYSLCEKHYNQVVVKKYYIKRAMNLDDSNFLDSEKKERKRPKLSGDIELSSSEKTFSEFGVQVSLPDEALLKRIHDLEDLNQQLLSENAILKQQLNEIFADQQVRIRTVTEIAKRERGNLYNDVTSLIDNHERFGLDNLLEYSPSKWLAEQNPVIVRFIEILTHNKTEHQNEGEKLFKCAVAVDAIYSS